MIGVEIAFPVDLDQVLDGEGVNDLIEAICHALQDVGAEMDTVEAEGVGSHIVLTIAVVVATDVELHAISTAVGFVQAALAKVGLMPRGSQVSASAAMLEAV